jgi:hypothetical protein
LLLFGVSYRFGSSNSKRLLEGHINHPAINMSTIEAGNKLVAGFLLLELDVGSVYAALCYNFHGSDHSILSTDFSNVGFGHFEGEV